MIGQAVGFVHGTFSPHGFGAHPRSRNARCVRLFDYDAGRELVVAQLHGLRDEAGKGDSERRDRQSGALVDLIRQVWRPGEPLVVCGDLNVTPDTRVFDVLARLGLTDLVTMQGFSDTRTSYYDKPGRYADYLLVTPDITVVDFDVVADPEVSDHRPLVLTLR